MKKANLVFLLQSTCTISPGYMSFSGHYRLHFMTLRQLSLGGGYKMYAKYFLADTFCLRNRLVEFSMVSLRNAHIFTRPGSSESSKLTSFKNVIPIYERGDLWLY